MRLSVSAEPARWRTLPWPARAASAANTGFTATAAPASDTPCFGLDVVHANTIILGTRPATLQPKTGYAADVSTHDIYLPDYP